MDGVRGLRLEGGIHFAVIWRLASGGRDVDVDQLVLNSTRLCSRMKRNSLLDEEMFNGAYVLS